MSHPDAEVTAMVVEEVARVGVHEVDAGRVHVHITVDERDEAIRMETSRQQAGVERVECNIYVDAAPPVRREGDTIVVPIVEEVMVKRLLLREEVRIRITETADVHDQVVRLRREHAHVASGPAPALNETAKPRSNHE